MNLTFNLKYIMYYCEYYIEMFQIIQVAPLILLVQSVCLKDTVMKFRPNLRSISQSEASMRLSADLGHVRPGVVTTCVKLLMADVLSEGSSSC